jgi:hypothetical protein
MSGASFSSDDARVVDLAMTAARDNDADLSTQVENAVTALVATNGSLYKDRRSDTGRQNALAIIEAVIEKERTTSFSSSAGAGLVRQMRALRMERVEKVLTLSQAQTWRSAEDNLQDAAEKLVAEDPYYRSIYVRDGTHRALSQAIRDLLDVQRDQSTAGVGTLTLSASVKSPRVDVIDRSAAESSPAPKESQGDRIARAKRIAREIRPGGGTLSRDEQSVAIDRLLDEDPWLADRLKRAPVDAARSALQLLADAGV